MSEIKANGADANKFLSRFPGPLYTISRDGGTPIRHECPAPEDMQAFLDSCLSTGLNVYVEANVVKALCNKPAYKERMDFSALRVLFVDLDCNPTKAPEIELNRLLNMMCIDDLEAAGIPEPTAYWSTGGGVQAVWELSSTLPPESHVDEDSAYHKAAKALQSAFPGAKGGGTWNMDRLLRCPGSVNVLSPKKVKEGRVPAVSVLQDINNNKYNLADFDGLVSNNPCAAKPKAGQPAAGYEVTASAEKVEKLEDIRTANGNAVWLNISYLISQGAPCQMNDEMRAEYERSYGAEDKKSRTDRSEYVMQVCAALVRLGVPDSQILGIITDERWAISAHVLDQKNPDTYSERQVRRAHGYADADVKAPVVEDTVEYLDFIPDMLPHLAKGCKDVLALTGFKKLKDFEKENKKLADKGLQKIEKAALLDDKTAAAVVIQMLCAQPNLSIPSICAYLNQDVKLMILQRKFQSQLLSDQKREAEEKSRIDANRRSQEEQNKNKSIITVEGCDVDTLDAIIPRFNKYLAKKEDIYTVGRRLSRWSQSTGMMTTYESDGIAAVLSQGFSFRKVREDSHGMQIDTFLCMCPSSIRKSYLNTQYYPEVRPVDAVLNHPVVMPNGDVLGLSAGYYPNNSFLFPEGHNQADLSLDESYRLVHDLLHEFPEGAIPGALALMFTALMRAVLPASPMIFINAPLMGSGKSLLANVCLILAYGEEVSASTQPKTEEEFEKQTKAHVAQHPGKALFLDDFAGQIGYQILRTMLTTKKLQFRILGTAVDFEGPVNFMVVMTGNNADLHEEIMRRSVVCTVDTGLACPSQRKTVRSSSQLMAYAKQNRTKLLSAVLNILTDALKNATDADNTREMGSFEAWTRTVGRSIKYATSKLKSMGLLSDKVVDGDITPNMEEYVQQNDSAGEALEEIYKINKNGYWLVKDLKGPAKAALDELLGTTGEEHTNDARGRRLAKYAGSPRVRGDNMYQLDRKGRQWSVTFIKGPDQKKLNDNFAATQVHKEAAKLAGADDWSTN